jgi:cytochrome c2
MRSGFVSRALGLLVGLGVVVVVGVVIDQANDRSRAWAHAAATTGGDPQRGEALFIEYGCGSCHQMRHVRKATGMVGPSLDGVANRAVLAGKLDNNPDNLQRWIRDPQAVTPGTAMPDLRVGQSDGRDITAFLYTRTN